MPTTAFARVALATALIFAFSACSESSSGPDFDGTANTEDTEEAGAASADFATEIADAMNFGSPGITLAAFPLAARAEAEHPFTARTPLGGRLVRGAPSIPGLVAVPGAPIQFSAAVGCSLESRGTDGEPFNPYDGNENLVPDDWWVRYVCTFLDSTSVDNIVTHRILIEAEVKENMSSLHGYTASSTYEESYADEEGNQEGQRIVAHDFIDVRTDGISRRASFRLRGWGTSEGVTNEGILGEESSATFDPDVAISGETSLPSGDLDFTGKQYYYNTEGTSLSFTLDTPTPLHYNAVCLADGIEPPFDSGELRGRLNGNSGSARFLVTFADCDDFTIATENTDDVVHSVSARR